MELCWEKVGYGLIGAWEMLCDQILVLAERLYTDQNLAGVVYRQRSELGEMLGKVKLDHGKVFVIRNYAETERKSVYGQTGARVGLCTI